MCSGGCETGRELGTGGAARERGGGGGRSSKPPQSTDEWRPKGLGEAAEDPEEVREGVLCRLGSGGGGACGFPAVAGLFRGTGGGARNATPPEEARRSALNGGGTGGGADGSATQPWLGERVITGCQPLGKCAEGGRWRSTGGGGSWPAEEPLRRPLTGREEAWKGRGVTEE